MNEPIYVVTGRKRDDRQRYALTDKTTDYKMIRELVPFVSKRLLPLFSNIRVNRVYPGKELPTYDTSALLSAPKNN